MAQSMRSEPFGVARAACFEQLACVFASCGASFLLIPNAVLIQIPDIQRVICARVGKITHPRVFKHLCVSDLGPNEATLSGGIFLHKYKTPRAQIMDFITEVYILLSTRTAVKHVAQFLARDYLWTFA